MAWRVCCLFVRGGWVSGWVGGWGGGMKGPRHTFRVSVKVAGLAVAREALGAVALEQLKATIAHGAGVPSRVGRVTVAAVGHVALRERANTGWQERVLSPQLLLRTGRHRIGNRGTHAQLLTPPPPRLLLRRQAQSRAPPSSQLRTLPTTALVHSHHTRHCNRTPNGTCLAGLNLPRFRLRALTAFRTHLADYDGHVREDSEYAEHPRVCLQWHGAWRVK